MQIRSMRVLPLCLCTVAAPTLRAQSSGASVLPPEPKATVQRFEIGSQYAFLGKGVCYRTNCEHPPEIALGSDFTWNATPHVALDVVYDATLTAQHTPGFFSDGSVGGGRGSLLAAGPRLEVRREHYGLFIFGHTGAELWTKAPNQFVFSADGKPLNLSPTNSLRTFFAVGAGAGAEYSPSPRWHVRAAVSERFVDYGQRYQGAFCSTCGSAPTAWDSGEDFSAGVYKGFGAPVGAQGAARREVPPHRFFDKWNNVLIAGAALASVGDAVTTQLFLDNGLPEGSPIERTFVQHGVGGDIALGAIVGVAGIGAMYGLHRMDHHWLERALPAAILVLGTRNTYLNSKAD